MWNDPVFGAVTGMIAITRVSGTDRAAWLSWLNVLVGAWVFASAFWLDDTSTAAINDVIAGTLIVAFALASISASDEGPRERAPR